MFKIANTKIFGNKKDEFKLKSKPDIKINLHPSVKQENSRIIEQLAADKNKTSIRDLFDDEKLVNISES